MLVRHLEEALPVQGDLLDHEAASIARAVAAKEKVLPAGANLRILYDNTDMLRARINLLVKNGLIGLGIVFFVLWMFLNVRLSFWCGMVVVRRPRRDLHTPVLGPISPSGFGRTPWTFLRT